MKKLTNLLFAVVFACSLGSLPAFADQGDVFSVGATAAGGTDALRVDSALNTIIKNNLVSSGTLNVVGATTLTGNVALTGGVAASSNITTTNGQIGVGDATPDAPLELVGNAGDTYSFLISSANQTTNEVAFDTALDQLEIGGKVSIGQTVDATPDAQVEIIAGAGIQYGLKVSSGNGSTDEIAYDTSLDQLEVGAKLSVGQSPDQTPDAQVEIVAGAGIQYGLKISSGNGSTDEIAYDTSLDQLEISAKVSIGQTVDATPDGTVEIVAAAADTFSLLVSSVGAAVSHLAVRSASNGHIEVAGAAPTLINCGTTPAVVGSDVAGKITIGSSAGNNDGCTVVFHRPYAAAPACLALCSVTQVVSSTSAVAGFAFATTGAGDPSGEVCSFQCLGQDAD